MKKYILLHILLITLFCNTFQFTSAQSEITGTYNFSNLTGNQLRDFTKDASWQGTHFEYMYNFPNKIAIGVVSGFHSFYEKRDRTTYYFQSGAATGVTWRYLLTIPLISTVKYNFEGGAVKPYIGAGMGVTFVTQELDVADYEMSEQRAPFSLLAEAGLKIPVSRGASVLFNTKYNWATYKPEHFKADNLGYITVGLGMSFLFDR
ncbi:MAG: outer membrane beta-barrel protein [Niabella sp.]